MWLQRYRFESYYLPMSFSLIKNIFKKFQYLIKADSFIFKKFMVGNITLSIKKDYYVNIHSLFLLTNYIRYFFTKIFLNNFVHFFNFYFTNHVNYYFYFLDKFFIYRFFWFSYIKYTLRYWTLYNLRSMRLLLPLNSRLKFNYEKEFKKTFLTLSAGLILKFFKIKKKSKKQSKKIFNLLILFLKSFLRFKKYYIMIFFFSRYA